MAKLPIVSGTEAVKALIHLGFFVDRQRGSHVALKRITPVGEPIYARCPHLLPAKNLLAKTGASVMLWA
jgi:hypothetical protein